MRGTFRLSARCFWENENANFGGFFVLVLTAVLALFFYAHGPKPFSVFDWIILVFGICALVACLLLAVVATFVSVRNYRHMRAKLKLQGPSAMAGLDSVGHCAQVGMKLAQSDLERR